MKNQTLEPRIYRLMKNLKHVANEQKPINFGLDIISLNGCYNKLLEEAKDTNNQNALELLKYYLLQRDELISARCKKQEVDIEEY